MKQKTHLIFGNHAVTAALENGRRTVFELWVTAEDKKHFLPMLPAKTVVRVMERKDFDREFKNQNHQCVALRVSELAQPALEDILPQAHLLLVLDQVTDPHNVGAVLRSADAFGCDAVLVPSHNSAPLTEAAGKAASGAAETVPYIGTGNLNQTLEQLKTAGFWIVGLAGDAQQQLADIDLKGKIALVMGSEGKGMRQQVEKNCDFLAKLPMVGTVESLNVSVAAGIALYEAFQQRHA